VRVLHDLTRLVTAWWNVDRVRVSPDEGRLLRLASPSVVVVEARPAEVLSRTVGQSAAGPFVLYDCRGVRGTVQLRVLPLGPGQMPQVTVIENGVERSIPAASIDVFGPAKMPVYGWCEPESSLLESDDEAGYG